MRSLPLGASENHRPKDRHTTPTDRTPESGANTGPARRPCRTVHPVWKIRPIVVAALVVLAFSDAHLHAHDGRRLVIRSIGGRLSAVGTIQGTPPIDDGAGLTRPYANALHDHWSNGPTPDAGATATLPGFDLDDTAPIAGFGLHLTLLGVSRWVDPPIEPADDLVPALEPGSPDDQLAITIGGNTITTDAGGTLTLLDSVPSDDVQDIDLLYAINSQPSNTIYILDVRLESDAPAIRPSPTIHIILAPDGDTPNERRHLATLHLERALGDPLPVPCRCEFDGDPSTIGELDLLVFVDRWFLRDPTADLNDDRAVTITDLLTFLDCYFDPTSCA